MKKLSLESFFHPELPNGANRHQWDKPSRTTGGRHFPYVEKDEDEMTGEEALDEVGLMEFKLGRTMPVGDNLSAGGKMNSSQVYGKGSKSFANYLTKKTSKVPRVETIDQENFDSEDEYDGLDEYLQNENKKKRGLSLLEFTRGARESATKEMAPVSTKQPWASGLPASQDNPYFMMGEDETDKEWSNQKIEDELEMTLESMFHEWADTDWSRAAQSRKAYREDADLDFFDRLEGKGEYLMNSEEEFRDEQRKKGKKVSRGKKK